MATEYDRHHRYPRGHYQRNKKKNIVRVPRTQHAAFHTLFHGVWDKPHEIARLLNETYINPDYQLFVRKRR